MTRTKAEIDAELERERASWPELGRCARCGDNLSDGRTVYQPSSNSNLVCFNAQACDQRVAAREFAADHSASPTPTPELVWTSCLECGKQFKANKGTPRFCSSSHEATWWSERRRLATVGG